MISRFSSAAPWMYALTITSYFRPMSWVGIGEQRLEAVRSPIIRKILNSFARNTLSDMIDFISNFLITRQSGPTVLDVPGSTCDLFPVSMEEVSEVLPGLVTHLN